MLQNHFYFRSMWGVFIAYIREGSDVMISCFSSNVVKSYHTADIFCLTSTSLDAKQDPKSEQFFRLASQSSLWINMSRLQPAQINFKTEFLQLTVLNSYFCWKVHSMNQWVIEYLRCESSHDTIILISPGNGLIWFSLSGLQLLSKYLNRFVMVV